MIKDEDGQFKPNYNREDIEKFLEEVMNKPTDSERRIFGYRGCITEGFKNINDVTHCGNRECSSCNEIFKAMEQAIKDFKDEE